MRIHLHKNARTTPAVRRELQESSLSERALARKHGISRTTARKGKQRESVEDASHRPHTLHTTLNPAQEAIVVYLRQSLRLPLDDLLVVTREFLHPGVSRSGLDHCLRRHRVANLKTLQPAPEKAKVKPFNAYEPGFVHIDVKYLPALDGESRRYLFVAIDRATRWVYVEIKPKRTAYAAKTFLKALLAKAPFRIVKLLTDNGSEFTDRFLSRAKQPTGPPLFDQACRAAAIEHRLIPPRHPQTNGMVERFNGRIAEILQTHRFNSAQDLETTLYRYVDLYNHHIPQRALGHLPPIQALKNWQTSHPHLFAKKVGSIIVAALAGDCIQLLEGDAGLEVALGFGQGFQFLVRRHHVLVAVVFAELAFGIDRFGGESVARGLAGSMEVEILGENAAGEGVDLVFSCVN